MAAIVNIDQPLNQLSLKEGERRTLGFDLVNVAERSLHVTVTTTPEPGHAGGGKADAVPAWIRLTDEPTFRLAPKETRKVELEIAPPKGTAATGTGFRLKVFEVALPEENNSFSEPVQVTVTAAAPTDTGNKPPWKLIGAIAAALLLLIVAGGGWYVYGLLNPDTLPDVEGRPLAEAIAALEDAGIDRSAITEDRPIERDADGTVTAQSPAGGTAIEDGLVVTLTAPRPPETITLPRLPDGATAETAQATYGELGLEVELTEDTEAEGKVPGLVVSVTPEPGSTVHEGDTIEVRVLSATTEAPNLRGNVLTAEARERLEASFELLVNSIADREREANFVLAQPHHGMLERGSEVVVVKTHIPGIVGDLRERLGVEQLQEVNPVLRRQIEEQVHEFRPNIQLFQQQR